MAELKGIEILSSIEEHVSNEIIERTEKIDTYKSELLRPGITKEREKHLREIIKEAEEKIVEYSELRKALFEYRTAITVGAKFQFPSKAKEHLEELGALISPDELKEIGNIVNSHIRKEDSKRRKIAEEKAQKVILVLNGFKLFKPKLKDKTFIIKDMFGKSVDTATLGQGFDDVVRKTKIEALSDTIFLTPKENTESLPFVERMFLEDLEKFQKENKLPEDKCIKDIISNINEIKRNFEEKEKLKKICLIIDILKPEIVEYQELQSYLQNIKNKAEKEITKIEKYLLKFDFETAQKKVSEVKEKENKEQVDAALIAEYTNLAYELEKAMTETPNDFERINAIKAKMQAVTQNHGDLDSKFSDALVEGKKRYSDEEFAKKMTETARKAEQEEYREMMSESMKFLREEAIRELEQSGAFDEVEFRDGDVKSKTPREELITRKMAELKHMAEIDPLERGIEDQIKKGSLKEGTTAKDIPLSLQGDLRYAYRDDTSLIGFEYIAKYKKIKAEEKTVTIEPQSPNIKAEYIKYRAGLPEKSSHISFRQFAKLYYDLEITEELTEEEIQNMGGR